ncbi:MAG: glycosyltransferase [Anaerolineales bacterium]
MLQSVLLGAKQLEDFQTLVGDEEIEAIRALAEPLRGARVLHINATSTGGGVVEILRSLVPLMRDVGLEAEWQVIRGDNTFFEVTKACHNGLQGMDLPLTEDMRDVWRHYNKVNGTEFEGDYDFVVVHDPQPAGLLFFNERRGGKHWLWRCHLDSSTPNPEYWDFLAPYIKAYDASVFTMGAFVGPGLEAQPVFVIPPTIDPLSPKNAPIPLDQARQTVESFGVDLSRPLITQVSRFDPWKDPLGVVDVYRKIKARIAGVQLALLGAMATDDPEGWFYLDKTARRAGEDKDILILHNLQGVGDFQVGCFQSAADVVIQKSLKEGFGLVVAEAMWKGKPVVGGHVGGIPLQIIDQETGFLVDNIEDCAERAEFLLVNPEQSHQMGINAREHVRRNFLSSRHLKDYLTAFTAIDGTGLN